jgi:SAM-dependent methyltransferase
MPSWKSFLVKRLGFPATLIHGDTLVLDRWLWLRKRLPIAQGERLLDVGCGTGAFTIGAALRGYRALGLSWDERNNRVAAERAQLCRADTAEFAVCDVRTLDSRGELHERFDTVVCAECIEHILDDEKLVRDMAKCLRLGGRLLLSTPNMDFKPITPGDEGPFSQVEDGGHVRKGYSADKLRQLSSAAGLSLVGSWYCGGFVSQKVTWVLRVTSRLHWLIGWLLVLPLRALPPMLDPLLHKIIRWPYYTICVEARKPASPGTV